MFCSQYTINTADTSNGLPGVLYGKTVSPPPPWFNSSIPIVSDAILHLRSTVVFLPSALFAYYEANFSFAREIYERNMTIYL
jgi:hypothetical protein